MITELFTLLNVVIFTILLLDDFISYQLDKRVVCYVIGFISALISLLMVALVDFCEDSYCTFNLLTKYPAIAAILMSVYLILGVYFVGLSISEDRKRKEVEDNE